MFGSNLSARSRAIELYPLTSLGLGPLSTSSAQIRSRTGTGPRPLSLSEPPKSDTRLDPGCRRLPHRCGSCAATAPCDG